jgi:hypothetical protein
MLNRNYALSGWIENLGVEPLFLSFAFLLAPLVDFLLALLVLVTLVLDTMRSLLTYLKSRVAFYVIIGVLSSFLAFTGEASTQEQSMALGLGEHKEIVLPKDANFTIGNKQILGHKVLKKTSKLVLKAKKIGFSEVVLWQNGKLKQTLKIFVLSKNESVSLIEALDALEKIKLDAKINGPVLEIEGKITELQQYNAYNKIVSTPNLNYFSEVKLDFKLKNQIITEVYKMFFERSLDSIQCKNMTATIYCFYESRNEQTQRIESFLMRKYRLIFDELPKIEFGVNHFLELQIVEIESNDTEDRQFGLDKISGKLGDLLDDMSKNLIRENLIKINDQNLKISTLAKESILIQLDKENQVKIGSEIAFRQDSVDKLNTNWKFAGLTLNFLLKKVEGQFSLKYEQELSRPLSTEGAFQSSQTKSEIFIKKDKQTLLQNLYFESVNQSASLFPLLNKIPLIGNLFTSNTNSKSMKNVFIFARLSHDQQ